MGSASYGAGYGSYSPNPRPPDTGSMPWAYGYDSPGYGAGFTYAGQNQGQLPPSFANSSQSNAMVASGPQGATVNPIQTASLSGASSPGFLSAPDLHALYPNGLPPGSQFQTSQPTQAALSDPRISQFYTPELIQLYQQMGLPLTLPSWAANWNASMMPGSMAPNPGTASLTGGFNG